MILNGKIIAQELYADLTEKIAQLAKKPKLVVVLVGENPASMTYVAQKEKFAKTIGILFELHHFENTISESELIHHLHELNSDPSVSGYLVQLPLPAHIDTKNINLAIDPKKDVDGFTPHNMGLLTLNEPFGLKPCTPKGIMRIFAHYNIDLIGKHVTIIGRSNIVGKPTTLMLMNAGATVINCNHHTKDIAQFTRQSDIIVIATGQAHLLKKDMVKPGTIIIDVGISRINGKLLGDADFEALEPENLITPVPG